MSEQKRVVDLKRLEATELDDDDLILVFDASAEWHNKQIQSEYGAIKGYDCPTKCIRVADLRDFILNAPPVETGERVRWAARKNAKRELERAFEKRFEEENPKLIEKKDPTWNEILNELKEFGERLSHDYGKGNRSRRVRKSR